MPYFSRSKLCIVAVRCIYKCKIPILLITIVFIILSFARWLNRRPLLTTVHSEPLATRRSCVLIPLWTPHCTPLTSVSCVLSTLDPALHVSLVCSFHLGLLATRRSRVVGPLGTPRYTAVSCVLFTREPALHVSLICSLGLLATCRFRVGINSSPDPSLHAAGLEFQAQKYYRYRDRIGPREFGLLRFVYLL